MLEVDVHACDQEPVIYRFAFFFVCVLCKEYLSGDFNTSFWCGCNLGLQQPMNLMYDQTTCVYGKLQSAD